MSMIETSTEQLRPLVSFDERIAEISSLLSEMQICVDRNAEETKALKVMLGKLKQILDDMTCE